MPRSRPRRRSRVVLAVVSAVAATGAGVAGWATVASSAPAAPRIDRVAVVNADTDRDTALAALKDGSVLDPAALKAATVSLRAYPGPNVGSVRFAVDGRTVRVENYAPYVIGGDDPGNNYRAWKLPAAGRHVLTVTPYSQDGGRGTAGRTWRASFVVGIVPIDPTPLPTTPAPSPTTPAPTTPSPTSPSPSPTPSTPDTPPTHGGRYLYVAPDGSDRNSGLSAASPFKTVQKAADVVNPGDTVLAATGTYSAPGRGAVASIRRSGKPGQEIVFGARKGQKPVMYVKNWSGFRITGSYVTIQDWTVTGNSREVTLDYAMSQKNNTNNPVTSGNCVFPGAETPNAPYTHHITVQRVVAEHCPGGGIVSKYADYLTVQDNTVVDDAKYSPFGGSGISFLESVNSDRSTGYKLVIRRNVVWDSANLVPWKKAGKITDGNCIIIDSHHEGYTGRTLIENNVTGKCGARGIEVFNAGNADIFSNSLYSNGAVLKDGDLTFSYSSGGRIFGNVVATRAGQTPIKVGNKASGVTQGNNYVTGVRFVDPERRDLRLAPGSAGVDGGAGPATPATDLTGRARPLGRGPDAGAYENR